MIPVFKPSIRRKEMDSVLSSLVSDQIGPNVIYRELVKELSVLVETFDGFALREYDRAVALALKALDLQENDGVVLSALCPFSYYRVIRSLKLTPVPVDVDSYSMCIDYDAVETRVKEGAKAVIADGPFGFVPPLTKIAELGVPLIEDITTTLGGHTRERACGTYGDHVIIRLEQQDLITSGGGTVVISRKKGGFSSLKQAAEELPEEAFLSDMNAALAKIQIKELEHYFERRRELYSFLSAALRRGKHGAPVQTGESEPVAYSFPVLIEGSVKEVQSYARKKGVETKRAFSNSLLAAGIDPTGDGSSAFPNAGKLLNSCILFPLFPRMPKGEADKIARVLTTLP
ncbi:MAG: DegT/DnrJ/EryC1/StrS family aminotransferase [Sediminispirochaetaceae bacterium]